MVKKVKVNTSIVKLKKQSLCALRGLEMRNFEKNSFCSYM